LQAFRLKPTFRHVSSQTKSCLVHEFRCVALDGSPYKAEYKGTGDAVLCDEHRLALPDHIPHKEVL
jgi:hypothetical protein